MRGLAVASMALVLALAACSDEVDSIIVLGASSTVDVLTEMAAAFEAENPGVEVVVSTAGSAALREQILAGSPGDVFISADEDTMTSLVSARAVQAHPIPFARNVVVVAVPAGNPAGVVGIRSFGDPDLVLGLCQAQVPCGRAAWVLLSMSGIVPELDTEEPSVRSLLAKIASGELDAGIVYRTDVLAASGSVEGIEIPEADRHATTYQIAPLNDDAAAVRFVEFAVSQQGRAILERHGFGLP